MQWTMTQREVKFYEFKCDYPQCTTANVVASKLPESWANGTLEVHDCGATGYTRIDHLHYCATCVAAGRIPQGFKAA